MIKSTGYKIYIITIIILITGCYGTSERKNPVHIHRIPQEVRNLKNLQINSPSNFKVDTVELIRKQIFESNNQVFINGHIGEIAVDDKNRVFIMASKIGAISIYVFMPNGDFISTIGRVGRGPGEFTTIWGMEIRDEQLFVYDSSQRRISIFSLSNFALTSDAVLSRAMVRQNKELASLAPGHDFYVINDDKFLLNFQMKIVSNEYRKNLYYYISRNGIILPDKILERQRFKFYMTNMKRWKGVVLTPFTMPFTRNKLIAISKSGNIFTANTENFLIKVYDENGNYQRAFYYPYEKSKLHLSTLNISEGKKAILANTIIPKTWPALHNMVFDDQNRLWVFTITDSDKTFKGWVLNEKGKLIAKFNFPGRRSKRSVMSKPLMLIKNGYLYTHQQNLKKGTDRIVKYKIEFKAK